MQVEVLKATVPLIADVTIMVSAPVLFAFATSEKTTIFKYVRIYGDPEFSAIVTKLAKYLRWDLEEDLARLLSDASARRIMLLERLFSAYIHRAVLSVPRSLTKYLLDDNLQLVHRTRFDQFSNELANICDMLAWIENSISCIITRYPSTNLSIKASFYAADDPHSFGRP
ncbi:hypothetical protein [Candidatus Vallotia tarda]|uniref:hypothetical protein n=1 Tax=Candidatus Vallotiella hemipterorum TaxID=1177213 RepID=UPI001C1F38A7|nr:hypothetical protein [Candidatus Vallotia tarda]